MVFFVPGFRGLRRLWTQTQLFFSLRSLITNELYVAVLWLCVWLLTKANVNFSGLLVPRSLSARDNPGDDEFDISIVEEAFNKEAAYTEKEAALSNKLRVIQAIDARVARLRRRTTLMLFTAGVLLVGASLIIVFAGTLTNLDVSAASNVDKLTSAITDVEAHLARLSDLSALTQNRHDAVGTDSRKEIEGRISSLRNLDRTLPGEAGVPALADAEQKRLAELEELYHSAWTSELGSQHGYNDVRYIVATAITRIGVVLVIIFLAQILIGLYRYNTRLITFYHSRRDLVQIWDGKSDSVDKLQNLMAPNIEFGKEPKHPLDEIIRQVIAKMPLGGGSVAEGGKATP